MWYLKKATSLHSHIGIEGFRYHTTRQRLNNLHGPYCPTAPVPNSGTICEGLHAVTVGTQLLLFIMSGVPD